MADTRIEILARGILLHDAQLLVCENVTRGHRFLPGGHVEFGEPAATALAREIREELDVTLDVGRFRGVHEASFIQEHRKGPRRHHELNLIFDLLPPDGFDPDSLTSQEPQINFRWVALDDPTLEHTLLPAGILDLVRSQTPPDSPSFLTSWT